jgi:hypothetical protein
MKPQEAIISMLQFRVWEFSKQNKAALLEHTFKGNCNISETTFISCAIIKNWLINIKDPVNTELISRIFLAACL